MGLAEQYELLELVHRDVATTWLAVEKDSKRQLLLHKFKEDTGLRDRLISMAPNDLIMLVSAEKEGDAYLVVTHDVPALRRFREWVESRSDPPAPKEESAVGARGRVEAAFDPAATKVMPRKAFGAPPAPTSQVATPQPTSQSPAGDEFTRMFARPGAAARSPFDEETVSGGPAAGPPGEFTQMFGPRAAPAEPPPVLRNEPSAGSGMGRILPNEPTVPPATAAEPDDFTRMFQPPSATAVQRPPVLRNEPNPVIVDKPVLPNEPTVRAPTVPPPTAPPAAGPEPGEFTRMFRPSSATPMQRPPVLRNEPNPVMVDKPVLPNEPTVPPPVAPPPAGPEPGELTRMFQPSSATPVQRPPVVRNEPNPVVLDKPVLPKEPTLRPPTVPPPTAPPSAGPEPGDFTRMFRPPSATPVQRPPALRNEPNPVIVDKPVLPEEPTVPPPTAPPSGGSEPGEFTRMFQPSSASPAQPSPVLQNEPNPATLDLPVSSKQPAAPQPTAAEPGEFTRMFREPSAAPVNPPSVLRNEPNFAPPTGPVSRTQPSEFTRMFQTPAADQPAPITPIAPPPPKPASGAGEFTKIFSNPLPTTPLAEKLEGTHAASKEAAPRRPASDFTQMFGQPQNPATPGMAAPVNAGATGIFAGPKIPASGSAQPPAPTGPGEYTRMFGTPVAASGSPDTVSETPKAEQKPAAAQKVQADTKFWPLVIVLAVLLIAAILLLVYVLKKH